VAANVVPYLFLKIQELKQMCLFLNVLLHVTV